MDRDALRFSQLPEPARRELLVVLTASSDVRADLIRQMQRKAETQSLAEALIDLEEDDFGRTAVINAIRRSQEG